MISQKRKMMNKQELEYARQLNIQKVDKFRLSHKFGCVRINSKNTLKHEIAKLKDVWKAQKKGHIVATECVSVDGKRRFDFIDFDDGTIVEFETNHKIKKPGAITVEL